MPNLFDEILLDYLPLNFSRRLSLVSVKNKESALRVHTFMCLFIKMYFVVETRLFDGTPCRLCNKTNFMHPARNGFRSTNYVLNKFITNIALCLGHKLLMIVGFGDLPDANCDHLYES